MRKIKSNGKSGIEITTTWYAIWFALLMTIGFVWTTFKTSAPYGTFAEGLVVGLGVVITKRLIQKSSKFGGESSDAGGAGDEDDEVIIPDRSKK